jgi:flagellar basal-body rod modification protein FlgD
MATSIVSAAQSLNETSSSSSNSQNVQNSLTNEDTFLKLLVSQIQNQDPLNPADGVQFLTQLTGFSQLEQLMQINQELSSSTAANSTAATSGSSSTGTTTTGTTTQS